MVINPGKRTYFRTYVCILVLICVLVKGYPRCFKIFVRLHKLWGVFMGDLYETIQRLCQERNIRPGRLCNDLELSRSLMTDLKMGRKKGVSTQTAQKIAAYFDVSVGYLLGQEEPAAETQKDILDEVDVAFYGDFKELNEEQKETVRDMVRLMRQRQAAKQRDQSV